MKLSTTKTNRELRLIRALVHGDSGAGKTTSLGTLPEDSTLIIALERSLLPLAARDYRVIQAESWTDLRDLVRAMSTGTRTDAGLSFDLDGETIGGVKTVAIDSLSEVNDMCKRHIIRVDRKALVQQRTRGKSDAPEGIYEDQMTQEDWGVLGNRVAGFTNAVNHLPVHTIFTCLSAWTEDRRTGIVHRTPALSGKLAQGIAAQFDLVFHMETVEAERMWRTANDGIRLAKDSTGLLPELVAPDWRGVFAAILKGESK
jgi:hypothetical protein